MATGYDNRGGGRASFVQPGTAPVQTSTGVSGNSAGAQVQGGESIGGVVTAGMETNPGNVAAGLGQYFEQLMAPAVERAKTARFFQGFTAAQSGRALGELTHNDSPLTRVFGPSGFEAGAQFYHSQRAIDQWSTDRLAEVDTLKRLPPAELAQAMASTSQAMLTGDPYADELIQKGLLEAQGPLLHTIATTRFAWQQDEAVSAMSQAGDASATALQGIAAAQAVAQPSVEATEATRAQVQRFLGGMQKPAGMTDESYQKFLYNFTRNQLSNHNFYAVELMRRSGVMDVLTDAQQTSVEGAYTRFGHRAQEEAAGDPTVLNQLLELDAASKTERLSPQGVVDGLREVNNAIRARTGVDEDYFDAGDLRAAAGGVLDAQVARQRRLETRAQQIEDRNFTANAAAEAADARAEDAATAAQGAWRLGGVNTAITAGSPSSSFDVLATQDWQAGDITNIARAYRQEGWYSERLSTTIQSQVEGSIGESYSRGTAAAYDRWKQVYSTQPALAAALYGRFNLPLQNFDLLVTGGQLGPEEAYRQAFAKVGQYADATVSPLRRREVEAAITSTVGNEESYWFNPFGRDRMSATSQAVLTGAIRNYVAITGANSDRPTPSIMQEAVETMIANGTVERYGSLVWRNARPTQPLSRLLGLQPRDADRVISGVIDRRLRGARFSDGITGEVSIVRAGPSANPHFVITGHKDRRASMISMTLAEFRAAATASVVLPTAPRPSNHSDTRPVMNRVENR